MTDSMWWIGPTVIVLLRVLVAEARSSNAKKAGSGLIFQMPLFVRLLFGFVIIALFVTLIKGISSEETWVVVSGTILLIVFCLTWPATLAIDASGVSSYLWWKPKKSIPWGAVVDLQKNSGGDWKVCSSDGTTIDFSRYHVDPHRFEVEILKRANLRATTDMNAATSLHRS